MVWYDFAKKHDSKIAKVYYSYAKIVDAKQ